MKRGKVLIDGKTFREWKEYVDKELPYLEGYLNNISAEDLHFFVKDESLQIIALVFACLPMKKKGLFLKKFEMPLPVEIIRKSTTFDSHHRDSIKLLTQQLDLKIQSAQSRRFLLRGGVVQAAKILSHLDTKSRDLIIKEIEQRDNANGKKIKDFILTFEDILHLPNIEISQTYATLSNLWSIALRRATPELKKHILSSLSQRAVENLELELSENIPIQISQVESAQRKVLDHLKPLILLALDKTT